MWRHNPLLRCDVADTARQTAAAVLANGGTFGQLKRMSHTETEVGQLTAKTLLEMTGIDNRAAQDIVRLLLLKRWDGDRKNVATKALAELTDNEIDQIDQLIADGAVTVTPDPSWPFWAAPTTA